ncbi:hypothetical protein [Alkaliphilus oremlandii]|uniref:Uncharacterized protein n=1 Tax=Alkaliphilus oremlandii (strain OhILAs) TaxID=350688 RepID=A8MI35_ALKOO|nr:hypothetical protein [Alkaliphilus oremlandii]ABW19467.1 hypothetical protein Clos_1928 [Alkaliphilus oremlandii OhILAs]
MSRFQFLASDRMLMEVKNPYRELISINEAIIRNIKIPDLVMDSTEIDRDKKFIVACDSEEQLNALEIKNDMYYSSEYAKQYSNKLYFSELRFRYTEKRAEQLLDYLKGQINDLQEIELWSIWLGEEDATASIKSKNINELTIKDLAFLNKSANKQRCLIIKK